MNIDTFKGKLSITFLQALEVIDANTKGFLVAVDDNDNFIGVLTDGDIRRAFIKGASLTDKITSFVKKQCKTVNRDDDIGDVAEIFKHHSIKFLPVIDNGKLVNIITKEQFHSLLLQDIHADLGYDFSQLDENIVNTEIFVRPWGFYKTTVLNEYFQSKIISVIPGGKLSLQLHHHRDECWVAVHGDGIVVIGEEKHNVKTGEMFYIPRETKHRLINVSKSESLIITEVQLGDYFGENDIERYDDVYGRL